MLFRSPWAWARVSLTCSGVSVTARIVADAGDHGADSRNQDLVSQAPVGQEFDATQPATDLRGGGGPKVGDGRQGNASVLTEGEGPRRPPCRKDPPQSPDARNPTHGERCLNLQRLNTANRGPPADSMAARVWSVVSPDECPHIRCQLVDDSGRQIIAMDYFVSNVGE